MHVSLVDGYSFLDTLSWDVFNEGNQLMEYVEELMEYVEEYNRRFGYYPEEILADKIYCSRENRKKPGEPGIKL